MDNATLLLVGRILFGGMFVFSGLNHFMKSGMMIKMLKSKKLPAPGLLNLIAGLLLLGGGLGVVLGVYINYALWALVLFLAGASFLFHAFWKEKGGEGKMTQMRYFMSNMALAGAALAMLSISQPWIYSLVL